MQMEGTALRCRPLPTCIATRVGWGLAIIATAVVCIQWCLANSFSGIMHSLAFGVGLVLILDAVVARLLVDESAVAIRRLSGTLYLWRREDEPACAKLDAEIQRWRNSLSFDATEIAKSDWSLPRAQSVWPLLPLVVAAGAAFAPGFETPNVLQNLRLAVEVAVLFAVAFAGREAVLRLAGRAAAATRIATIRWGAAALLYLFSIANLANAALDQSSPRLYRVTVVATHDRSSHRSPQGKYYLYAVWHYYSMDLAPWSEQKNGQRLDIDSSEFKSFHAGDSVCILLHPGRFGVDWFANYPKCAP